MYLNKRTRLRRLTAAALSLSVLLGGTLASHAFASEDDDPNSPKIAELDSRLALMLRKHGFTGKVESTITNRLGRPINPKLADLGKKLFFDTAGGLHNDNTCAGCHAPANGMGDSQSIAIGVQNNGLVGPNRTGPRNQRRTPTVVNAAFYPALMWNGRFSAPSGDPFNNSQGYKFPPMEGTTFFPANDPVIKHLLIAQAHIPPTELTEAAGFTGTKGTISPRFDQFDDGLGTPVPLPDATGSRNEPIRQALLKKLSATPAYVSLFASVFPEVAGGAPISEKMFGQAIAEFEFTLVRANAPIDQFARGETKAMSPSEKRGALVFFGKANCVACHAVSGQSNEMFSDFKNRNVGVPQIAAKFGRGTGNVIGDGAGENEDFGLEQVSGLSSDRYKFRTSPLRNVALQPAFFHNGAYTKLEDAIRHHLDVAYWARSYNAKKAGVAADLTKNTGPIEPVLQTVDPLLSIPTRLTQQEFDDLVHFVGSGLLDPRAKPKDLCKLVPATVPSGNKPLTFEGCKQS